MSNVYSIEPPTTGKVILKTNFGNIDIELWTREAPKACRNFIQLCLDGYYDNNIFFRIIKGFMIQTGDPLNTGKGGESMWNKNFPDEFHARLKFCHRGIVAMANLNEPNTNGSQFFITMDQCNWLKNKHTIFGKVVGDTFFNALSISELPINKDNYPDTSSLPLITSTEVIINPFDDIIPREKVIKEVRQIKPNDDKVKQTLEKIENEKKQKDKRLISFYDDDNQQEDSNVFNEDNNIPIEEPVEDYNEEDADDNDDESVSLEEGYVPDNMKKVNIENQRKEEIMKLKTEIQNIKSKMNMTSDELLKASLPQQKQVTPLQKHIEKYLHLKTNRTSSKEVNNRLDKFKESLSNVRTTSNHWMNNKLKFHVDSQKAYAIDHAKEIEKSKTLFNHLP